MTQNLNLYINIIKRKFDMEKKKPTSIQYMCTYCGTKNLRSINAGRPMPGKCARRKGDQPHRWVINRKI